MPNLPIKLEESLENRRILNSYRKLSEPSKLVDFSSNDYLGFAGNSTIYDTSLKILKDHALEMNGATGSRLLSGNHGLFSITEEYIAKFHAAESALIFNSGYDANFGFLTAVPQRGDLVFFDELSHASIREGIKAGLAKGLKFKHNDLNDLQEKILKQQVLNPDADIYIITESVFSMDGDSPDLVALANLATENNYFLVIDEAHATGVFGHKGQGLVQELGIQDAVFARIHTFGKAMGCHGAVILGDEKLREYLINFSRSFIYTTALPPHSIATILATYHYLENSFEDKELAELKANITFFNGQLDKGLFTFNFIKSSSAIQCCLIPGNEKVKEAANILEETGYDVKPILAPTVPAGMERLRICLHSFNTKEQISSVLEVLDRALENNK